MILSARIGQLNYARYSPEPLTIIMVVIGYPVHYSTYPWSSVPHISSKAIQ